ncbi:TPA: exodeoxyribonuclease VIII [Escherichia coli]|nr:exodeoxyribonuclease VIII [Escherichia coli]HDY2491653.1 exodeoxyribonuclease VIII [Escherichia coli]HDY2771984.1 exodeoxyribonuclease VIII [Escherichia coli]
MSTKPLFLLRKAKKSSGEPDVVLWASNDFESTCATLDYLIVKSGKKLSSYFKAVATNFPVVNDLPAEGEIDFTWSERYQLSKDSMTWELKPGAAPDNAHYQGNTNVNGEDMTEIEENMLLPISGQELPIRWLAQHGSEKPVTHVSRDGLQALHIARAEELPAVTALAVSHKTSLLDPLEIRELHKLVRDTDKVFPNPGNSNLGLITAFFEAYLNADYTDRGLLTKEWMKGNRVSHITRTASGANAGGGNLTDRGEGFVHDLTSLARDVATGVLARSMDLDIYNLHPAHAKRIEEIIAENKPPFSVFRDKFITMPGGLDYSRAIVVASVKEAPIGIEVIPAHVTEYLNKVLTETDHANPDPEIVDIACGRSSAPMPQRVTEEGKQDDEEKPQPSGTTAVEQGEAETMEPDATEHHQDTQPLDAQSQVNSVDAKYQELRAELHEARKNIPSKNPVDADKLLAASRGEFVDGISDPNDPKWVKGIQTRDCSDETGEVADPVIVEDIEPGIYYGISNENYHAGPGISKSQLDDIADTPALYLWRKNAPVDTTKTKTLDLGTAFHCRVLEPEEFSNRFIVAPEFNRRTNAGKEEEKAFLMECASTGKTVITAEEGRKIELMYQSVMALPLGQWLVESAGHAESSIYWEDPETGILCRCRPDKIIPEFHWIMDVKTTADIQRFKTAYYDYRYHVQDAFYSDGYEAQFGVQPTFVFLVASTTIECGRYPVEIFMMGEEAKLAGQQEYHRNLRTLSDCLNTDEWPAIKTLSLPRWAKEYAND